ncbi:MAG: tRNA (adenosine(37)-N6)-threonylcarbamoyltransferase complex transferase subunit TsaD [Elusimicrobia bacterium]|nr:tRNA (adenosine(37)-N6)-threonylcarbamoyltransferase complex transferase subunit TsaD [Candidatus Liberimonas magnetica]
MLILGIETSCDETSIAVVSDGRKVIANAVASQINIHSRYSGVVPELASRAHLENINLVFEEALNNAKINKKDLAKKISAVSYTRGPGLAGALLVGQITAQTLSFIYKLPLVDVNHLEGHLYAALLEHKGLRPPYLCLIASGGHTELVIVKGYGKYNLIGATRDDAAGEAFDKVSKLLGLGYPGGPVIDNISKKGNSSRIRFPRPFLWPSWDFSFSGLKTAVVNHVKSVSGYKERAKNLSRKEKADISASFQDAVVETLIEKTIKAAKRYKMNTVVLGGGVSANSELRSAVLKRCRKEGLKAYLPSLELCTDNAAMIACAGYYKFKRLGIKKVIETKIEPNLKLQSW